MSWCEASVIDQSVAKNGQADKTITITMMNFFKVKTPLCVQLTLQLKCI